VTLFEALDALGGRVRSDRVDGFTLDRGFQVYLDAYPEGKRQLDLESLRLRPFSPGGLIWTGRARERFADPLRMPRHAWASLVSDVGSLSDKLRVLALRSDVRKCSPDKLRERPAVTTIERLRRFGFSDRIIERFFRPFYAGVFLESDLTTSSRVFDYTFRMFSDGRATLPENGIGAIAQQLADRLEPATARLHSPVKAVAHRLVIPEAGEPMLADAIVIATDSRNASRLSGGLIATASRESDQQAEATADGPSTTCLYYAAPTSPLREPTLLLNGSGHGRVNHLCVPSDVSSSYAPAGRSLVCVNLIGIAKENDDAIDALVRVELREWFGEAATAWQLLSVYRIRHALADQTVAGTSEPARRVRLRAGLYICGDHIEGPGINGALASGRRCAEAIIEDLSV
jgi:phytoene dehydrogenase-like protein